MKHYRLFLGNVDEAGLERIMETVRSEYRSDTVAWYTLERDHEKDGEEYDPLEPNYNWTEIEGDE
jgi:hypothetical protein